MQILTGPAADVTDHDYQVVIVGGGPVGVGLSIELGLRGISCAVFERHEEVQPIPKGQNLTQRTMEHFWAWGVEDEIRSAKPMPPGFPTGGITAYKDLASDHWFPWMRRELMRPYYFTDNERLPQYETERVLRAKAEAIPNVDLNLGWTVVMATQKHDSATIVAERTAGDGRQEVTADFVVGCDGARSVVRREAGIEQSLADHDRRMVLLLFRSQELHQRLERLPAKSFYKVLHPDLGGYWAFLGRVDLGEKWFFHCPVTEGTTAETGDWEGLLAKFAGGPFAHELDYVGFWDLRFASALTFRNRRLLIAGDACHSHPPYGGYGLNVGLEDARNLGWKLAAYLQGWAGTSLLDSYDLERRPVFETLSKDFIEASIQSDRQFVAKYSPDRDLARFEQAWADEQAAGTEAVDVYEPNYEGSPVVFGPAEGVCTAHGRHELRAQPGHHLAPLSLSDGRDVPAELGPGFTLLALSAPTSDVADLQRAAIESGVPLVVVTDDNDHERARYEARLVLVRPDHFVAWCGDTLDSDPATIIGRAIGILGYQPEHETHAHRPGRFR